MAAELTCRVADRTVAVRVVGSPDDRPVLFFAGTPNSRLIGPEPSVAEAAGSRVISFDRPGYGRSEWVERSSLDESAADTEALLDVLGIEQAAIAAWSAGTGHALAAASRLGPRCQGVTLVAPMGPGELADCRRALPRMARSQLAALRRLPRSARRKAIERTLGPAAEQASAETDERWRALLKRAPACDRAVMQRPEVEAMLRADIVETFTHAGDGWFEDAFLMTEPWPSAALDIEHPIRIWHGDHDDDVGRASGAALAERLPNATLRTLYGAGHYALFDLWPEILAP